MGRALIIATASGFRKAIHCFMVSITLLYHKICIYRESQDNLRRPERTAPLIKLCFSLPGSAKGSAQRGNKNRFIRKRLVFLIDFRI
jgi:hypothetical protein